MEQEPSFEDVLAAAVANDATDAAVADDAADPSALFAAVFGDDTPSPADDDTPDEMEADDDFEAADAVEETDDEDDVESELERLRQERDEWLQAKRDAEAQAAEAQAMVFWQQDRASVDGKLAQALTWLDQQSDGRYDSREFILQNLPTIIAGYTDDLAKHYAKREQAVWNVARQHGAHTYVQALADAYELTAADVQRVRKYPPELMEQAARDIVEARGGAVAPVANELTQTKTKLRKTETALKKQRRAQQITPNGVGRANVTSLRDVKSRITPDNADEIAGALFAAIGLTP